MRKIVSRLAEVDTGFVVSFVDALLGLFLLLCLLGILHGLPGPLHL